MATCLQPSRALVWAIISGVLAFQGCTSLHFARDEAAICGQVVQLSAHELWCDSGSALDLAPLGRFRELRKLKLRHTLVTNADLNHVAAVATLTHLDLAHTHIGDGALDRLAGLRQLQSLDLSNTSVTDTGLSKLAGLKSLKTLKLRNTDVTGAGVIRLQHMLPGCRIATSRVHVCGRHVRRTATRLRCQRVANLDRLSQLTALTSIDFEGSNVTDDQLVHLMRVPSLTHLSLANTKITDAGLAQLTSLRLRSLDLGHHENGLSLMFDGPRSAQPVTSPPVTDAGLVHVSKISSLRQLDLNNLAITDAGVARLTHLHNLEVLSLSSTMVTYRSIDHLAKLPRLSRLSYMVAMRIDQLHRFRKLKALRWLDFGHASPEHRPAFARLARMLPNTKVEY